MTAAGNRLLSAAHRLYKSVLAPLLRAVTLGPGVPTHCKFQPTCSDYATIAFARHGAIRGARLAAWRLLRCHPFTRGSWDPVPPARSRTGTRTGTIDKTHPTQDIT